MIVPIFAAEVDEYHPFDRPTAQKGEKVEARFPDAKEPVTGTLKDAKLSLAGRVYSAEAGAEADFHLNGTLADQELKGTSAWGEHQMTFTARKAD